jgi:hypothetical protein
MHDEHMEIVVTHCRIDGSAGGIPVMAVCIRPVRSDRRRDRVRGISGLAQRPIVAVHESWT